jgi:glycosyltransferase involved in cell wall biosynthesis
MSRSVLNFRDALGGTVLSFTDPSLLPTERDNGVRHLAVGRGPLARRYYLPSPQDLRAFASRLGDTKLILIHGLFRAHVSWAAGIARQKGIPYWIVPHGALDPYVFTYRALRKRAWMSLVGQPILSHASRVIVATERERVKAQQFLRGCRVETLFWPVEVVPHDSSRRARDTIRQRLGISQDARALLFLGRLDPMKRIRETIAAIAAADLPRVHLIVVGPGSDEMSVEECRNYATTIGAKRVHVVGADFSDTKNDWFAASDAYVSLSHRENFGYSAAEALSFGLPVILSPGNDLSPSLARVQPGWLLRSLAEEEAVTAFRDFSLCADDRLRSMGEAGRQWATDHLSEARFAATLRGLLA